MNLITLGNPKTMKSVEYGYLNAVLHLAPVKLAKRTNVCPFASPGCIKCCLNTAGRGGIIKTGQTTNKIQEARIRRTQQLIDASDVFNLLLIEDMLKLCRKADEMKLTPALRLNGTSDLDWYKDTTIGNSIFFVAKSLGIKLYDYTKDRSKVLRTDPSQYHLTFSRSELNESECLSLLQAGHNVAVVFRDVPPLTWNGYDVIDGDKHDLRFLDPAGVVVGLKAKGKAKRDTTGFVV